MVHSLHLTTWHPYINGSSGTFVLDQCAALKTAGARIGIIFSRVEGLRGLSLERFSRGLPAFVSLNDPVPTLGFKCWHVPGLRQLIPSVNTEMLVNRFRKYVFLHGKPDILHAHVALDSGPAARRVSAKHALKYVLTEHSSEILNGNLTTERRALAHEVYTDAHCVIAVSEPLADRILEIAPRANVKVINNLVLDSVFALKSAQYLNDNAIRIASVCSLVAPKRIQLAIQAIAALPDGLRNRVTYDVIGDGPERPILEKQAAAGGINAIFHGHQKHLNAMELLSRADLLLHPSSYETFGIVIAEAMALGIPAIATRCGGPQNIINDDTGILVPVDDVTALADALFRVLTDKDKWKSKSDTISAYARLRYHEHTISKKVLETYK